MFWSPLWSASALAALCDRPFMVANYHLFGNGGATLFARQAKLDSLPLSESPTSVQIPPPIPSARVIADPQCRRRTNALRDLRVKLYLGCPWLISRSEFSGSIALRTHGSQIDRSVSAAARVVDLRCRSSAHRANTSFPLDHLCQNLRRHHRLPQRVTPTLQLPKRLPHPHLPVRLEERPRLH